MTSPSSGPLSGERPPSRGSQDAKQRRPLWAALSCLALVSLAWLFWWVSAAWQATSLREAYLPDLEAAARRKPYDGKVQALLGGRLLEAAEYPAARDALKMAVAAGENSPEVWITLAAATAASGDLPRAAANLELGLQKNPGSPALLAVADRLKAGRGAAEQPVAVAAIIAPEGPRPLLDSCTRGSFLNGLAEWWGRQRPEQSGFATRRDWAVEKSEDPRVLRLWGEALLRNRRYAEAEAPLSKALAISPNDPEAHRALGDLMARANRPGTAAREYLTALKQRPRWLAVLLAYGRTSLDQELAERAIQSYTQATQVDPKSVEAWIGLGRANLATRVYYGAAADCFARAEHLAPERLDFFLDYADSLRLGNRPEECARIVRRYLAAYPQDSYAHYVLSEMLLNTERAPEGEAEAEKEARESLRLAPHNPNASLRLATILLRKGPGAEALSLLRDAARRDPYSISIGRLLARTLGQMGKPTESASASARAEKLSSLQQRAKVLEEQEQARMTDVAIHAELLSIYEQAGKTRRAQRERDVLELLRKDPQAAARILEQFRADQKDVFGQ
jgi:predicted Zn-dependent protease